MGKQLDNCSICKPQQEQVKLILFSLLTSLARIRDSPGQISTIQNLGFHGLMRIVFSQNFKTAKDAKDCSHQNLKKSFMAKLGVSGQQLGKFSTIKGLEIAKYNYHTDVLGLQIKTFHRHFPTTKSKTNTESRNSIEEGQQGSNNTPVKKQENSDQMPNMMLGQNVPIFNNQQFPIFAPQDPIGGICMNIGRMPMPSYHFPENYNPYNYQG